MTFTGVPPGAYHAPHAHPPRTADVVVAGPVRVVVGRGGGDRRPSVAVAVGRSGRARPGQAGQAEGRRHGRPRDAVVRPVGPRAARHPARHPEGARAQGPGRQARLRPARLLRGARRGPRGRSERHVRRPGGEGRALRARRLGGGAPAAVPRLEHHCQKSQDSGRLQRHHRVAAVVPREDGPGHLSRAGRGLDVECLQPGLDEAGAVERGGGHVRKREGSQRHAWCP